MAETTHVLWGDIALTAEPRRLVNLAFLTPRSAKCLHGQVVNTTALANLVQPKREICCTRSGLVPILG